MLFIIIRLRLLVVEREFRGLYHFGLKGFSWTIDIELQLAHYYD